MALKKDKQKVLGEIFDDERVRGFLLGEAPEGVSKDFYLLERAYRGMNIDNFNTFVEFFVAAGHDKNARNPDGKTMSDLVTEHRHGEAYLQTLRG